MLLLLACSGAAPDSGSPDTADTAPDTRSDTASDTDPDTPDPFSPIELLPTIWAGFDGEALTGFSSDGGLVEPSVDIRLLTKAYFNFPSDAEQCRWSGVLTPTEPSDLGFTKLWYQHIIQLSLVETDCEGLDPAIWGESTPTTVLQTTPITMAIARPQGLQFLLPVLYESLGKNWKEDGEPYIFSVYWMLPGSVELEEWGYGMSFAVDEQGALLEEHGAPVPQVLVDELPAGILYIIPYRSLSIDSLIPTP
jgi:hypothetical protein